MTCACVCIVPATGCVCFMSFDGGSWTRTASSLPGDVGFNVVVVPTAIGDVSEVLGSVGIGHVGDDCCSPIPGSKGMRGGTPGGLNPGTKVHDHFVRSATASKLCSPSARFVIGASWLPDPNSCSELTSSEAFSEVTSTPSMLALG